MSQPAGKPRRLRVEHLARDFFKNSARHLHEVFSGRISQMAAFSGRRDVALDEDIVPVSDYCRRTAATAAKEFPLLAVFADDFLNGHGFWMVFVDFG